MHDHFHCTIVYKLCLSTTTNRANFDDSSPLVIVVMLCKPYLSTCSHFEWADLIFFFPHWNSDVQVWLVQVLLDNMAYAEDDEALQDLFITDLVVK